MNTGDARFETVIWPWQRQAEGGKHDGKSGLMARDRGGATSYGISRHTYANLWRDETAWMVKHRMPNTVVDVTLENAKAITYEFYWRKPGFHHLPKPFDLLAFDWNYNGGWSTARFQRSLKVKPAKGHIGPLTCAAVSGYPDKPALVQRLMAARLEYLRGIRGVGGWDDFGKAWTKRCVRLEEMAMAELTPDVQVTDTRAEEPRQGLQDLVPLPSPESPQ